MDKKITFKFSKSINITIIFTCIICLIGLICDSVFLALAVKNNTPYTIYIVSAIMLVLLLTVVLVTKFCSYYKFEKDKLVFSLFCMKKRIEYSDILNIRHDKLTKQTIVYYNTYAKNGDKLVTYFILSVGNDLQKVVELLKEKNNLIIYEVFHDDSTDKEDN